MKAVNAAEFLGMTDDEMVVLRFERGMAWLEVMGFSESQRVALHQDPEYWAWWNNLWKYRLLSFLRANLDTPMEDRMSTWEGWMEQEFQAMIPVKLKRRIAQCA